MIHKSLIGKLFDIWKLSQIDLAETIRWGDCLEDNPDLRRQSVLDHTLSFSIVSTVALMMLRPYVKLDEALLQKAFKIHDLSEGILKRDIIAQKKKMKMIVTNMWPSCANLSICIHVSIVNWNGLTFSNLRGVIQIVSRRRQEM